jgi:pSer/pThr/pTyr-binding forkhead associated (FHA) protein
VIRRPGRPEHRVVLEPGVAHLGRAEDNDLVLTDIGVSRRHARILVQANGVWLEDLGSGNGTYCQGQRVTRRALKTGDEILVDPFTLAFEIDLGELPSLGGLTSELEDVGDEDTARVPNSITTGQLQRPSNESKGARLVTLSGSRLAPSYFVEEKGITIGRSDARDIILFDPSASRNHAVIEPVGDSFWLRDEGSGNGTFVNSSRVKEQSLRHGDRVRVGSTEFRFELIDLDSTDNHTQPPKAWRARRGEQKEVRVKPQMHETLPQVARVETPRRPPARGMPPARGIRVVAIAAVGGLAVVGMMFIGGLIALYLIEPELGQRPMQRVRSIGTDVATPQVDPQPAPIEGGKGVAQVGELQGYLDRGDAFFEDEEYLKAAAQYYLALEQYPTLVLTPTHENAQRMARVSTEYLMFATLHRGLVLRNLPEREQRRLRTTALQAGKAALRGRGDVKSALRMLREVLIFLPDDAQVQTLVTQLDEA